MAADGAVYRREDGIVIIDPEKAKGQKDIVNACPYRVIFWNEELELPQKCTMCAHRLDEGEKEPRCVEACPTGALVFGDLDDPQRRSPSCVAEPEDRGLPPRVRHQPAGQVRRHPQALRGRRSGARRRRRVRRGRQVTLEGDGVKRETTSDSFGDFEFEGLEKNGSYR